MTPDVQLTKRIWPLLASGPTTTPWEGILLFFAETQIVKKYSKTSN